MSRPRGPKLPKGLLDEVDDNSQPSRHPRGRQTSSHRQYESRKDRRKAERTEKKHQRTQPREGAPDQLTKDRGGATSRSDHASLSNGSKSRSWTEASKNNTVRAPTSKQNSPSSKTENGHVDQASRPRVSKAIKAHLDADDAEIAALEKRLGIKGKKNASRSHEDGELEYLIDEISHDGNAGDRKRKMREYDDYLSAKRKKARGTNRPIYEGSDDSMSDKDSYGSLTSGSGSDSSDLDMTGDGFDGFSDEESARPPAVRVRENPYVAPVAAISNTPGKYIPPSMRLAETDDTESMTRLRRQIQGSLNRLAVSNLTSILRDLESLYQRHPRQHVNSATIDLLIGLLADKTRLNDAFLILHAAFIAALYRSTGTEFGAQIIERLSAEFDASYEAEQQGRESKISANLITLISLLYVFQVIAVSLVFDYIRELLSSMTELNAELLLVIVRNCGPQLRQDDPSALKDIVAMLHSSAALAGEENLSVRTKFMLETVNNLKNNRLKGSAAASAATGEQIIQIKKALGSLPNRKANDPLRVGLADLRNADKRGKWWLVGASWKGDAPSASGREAVESNRSKSTEQDADELDTEPNLLLLAQQLRINTEIRRAIFISIMSATDYKDAKFRITKLHLKRNQELEIPRVLLKCASAEQNYNQYYTAVAQRLCSKDRKMQKAFQFNLWDLFRRLGEDQGAGDSTPVEDEDEDAMSMRQLVTLAKLFGSLMASSALPISSLKVLDFAVLQAKTIAFLEVLFTTVMLEGKSVSSREQRDVVRTVFEEAKQAPTMLPGLRAFLEQLPDNQALVGKRDQGAVRAGCQTAVDVLQELQAGGLEEAA